MDRPVLPPQRIDGSLCLLLLLSSLLLILLLLPVGAFAESPLSGFSPTIDNQVKALALQADGKILQDS